MQFELSLKRKIDNSRTYLDVKAPIRIQITAKLVGMFLCSSLEPCWTVSSYKIM